MFSEKVIEDNKQEFIRLLLSTNREGADKMVNWLSQSDFFIAPASTQYHLACQGGLCAHSLDVYRAAKKIKDNMGDLCLADKDISTIPDETIIISALLHDICKTNFYKPVIKWYKDESATIGQQWRRYMGYEINDLLPLGHGEKSVLIAQQFMKLTGHEILAIRWHMGFSDAGVALSPYEKPGLTKSLDTIPLVTILQNADLFATYCMECNGDIKKDNALD